MSYRVLVSHDFLQVLLHRPLIHPSNAQSLLSITLFPPSLTLLSRHITGYQRLLPQEHLYLRPFIGSCAHAKRL